MRGAPGAMAGLLAGLLLAGCAPAEDPMALQLQEALAARQRLAKENEALRRELQKQRQLVETLRALPAGRLESLVRVEKAEIGRYSGGVDRNGQPGHDAVRVYLNLFDQHGSQIKAAGDVTIQLYDLAAPPQENFLAEHAWKAEKLHERWAGGFISNHYVFDCPRPERLAHEDVTVRLSFTDYLTGRSFTDQRVVKVELPARATGPAATTAPAATD